MVSIFRLIKDIVVHECISLKQVKKTFFRNLLDSGVQRFDAHRFCLRNKMRISSHHFWMPIPEQKGTRSTSAIKGWSACRVTVIAGTLSSNSIRRSRLASFNCGPINVLSAESSAREPHLTPAVESGFQHATRAR